MLQLTGVNKFIILNQYMMENNSTNTFLGLLAGLATGAIIGILYAPDKGVKTRKLVTEKTKDTVDKLKAETEVAKSKFLAEVDTIKNDLAHSLSSQKKNLDDQLDMVISQTGHKAEDVITSLEKKLALLKDKSKKLQKTV